MVNPRPKRPRWSKVFDSYAEIFAERGFAYHRAMADCPRARDAEFHAVLEPFGEMLPGLLCDLPSGGGYLASYVGPAIRYVGVDPSDDFIDACPAGLERIKADITQVPLESGSVDYPVSLAALHHEPDLPSVFKEMRRLLRNGGRAVIADVGADTDPAVFLNGFVHRNNPMGHEGRFLDGSTSELLREAGFSVAEDRLIDVPWQFDSLEQSGAFCRQLFWMPSLDPQAVAEAMEAEIGFDLVDDRPRLRWKLRRFVCDAS